MKSAYYKAFAVGFILFFSFGILANLLAGVTGWDVNKIMRIAMAGVGFYFINKYYELKEAVTPPHTFKCPHKGCSYFVGSTDPIFTMSMSDRHLDDHQRSDI